MKPHNDREQRRSLNRLHTSMLATAVLLCLLLYGNVTAQTAQTDKIQQAVDAIKAAHYCMDEDYHTDGRRTVWVKSYKRWKPEDWPTVQKEAPGVLSFLKKAVLYHRSDVLEQLMPDYYRTHGGVNAFEKAINALPSATP